MVLNRLGEELVDRVARHIPHKDRQNAALALKALNRSLKTPHNLASMMVRERTWPVALKRSVRHGTGELVQAILRYMSAYGAGVDESMLRALVSIAAQRRTPDILRLLIGYGEHGGHGGWGDDIVIQAHMATGGLTAELQAIHARHDAAPPHPMCPLHHQTLLENAASSGRIETVQWLLTLRQPLNVGHLVSLAARAGHAECAKLLMPWCDAMAADTDHALYSACASGVDDVVRALFGLRHPPRGDCMRGNALMDAARYGRIGCMRLLLDSEHPPRADRDGSVALHMAIENAQPPEVLEVLLSSAHPPTPSCKQSGVHVAVRTGQAATARFLLEWGEDPPACTGDTVQAAADAGDAPMLEYLCSTVLGYDAARKADLARSNGFLVRAATKGHMSIVLWALEHGSGSMQPPYVGSTAMCAAASNGHCAVALELLQRAQPTRSSIQSDYAQDQTLVHACRHGHLALVTALFSSAHPPRGDCLFGQALLNAAESSSVEVARAVLSSQHPPRADMSDGLPLRLAARSGHAAMVDLLLRSAHPPRADCRDGEALVNAAASGRIDACTEAARVLLSSQPHPPRADCQHGAALTGAAKTGNVEMVRLLLASEYPPRADCMGGAALIEAASGGHVEVGIALLQSAHPPRVDSNHWEALCEAYRLDHIEMVALLAKHSVPFLRSMPTDAVIVLHNTPHGTPRYVQLARLLQVALVGAHSRVDGW
jgi:ankyrin repeat protein